MPACAGTTPGATRQSKMEDDMNRANGLGLAAFAAGALLIPGLLGGMGGTFTGASAQEPKLVRIVANRSVSGVALWGIGPFAQKHGLRTEMDSASTNAEMQR